MVCTGERNSLDIGEKRKIKNKGRRLTFNFLGHSAINKSVSWKCVLFLKKTTPLL